MDLTSYAGLQAAVADWVDRDDLTAQIPAFIMLAETAINLKLEHRKMETIVSLTPTDNVCSLPSDLLKIRRAVYGAGRSELYAVTPEAADEQYLNSGSSTCAYTIVGDNLKLYPTGTDDVELTYFQKVPALSDSNTSNWLLAEAPHLYLYATRAMAYDFFKEDASFQLNMGLASQIVESLNTQSRISQYTKMRYTPKGNTP